MMEPGLKDFYESVLFKSTGQEINIIEVQFVSGGCINNTVKISTEKGNFFLKWNESMHEDMFPLEARGLNLLKSVETIKIPDVIGFDKIENKNFLLLEFIDSKSPSPDYWEKLGKSLAEIHKSSNEKYGLSYDNYIGELSQKNKFKNDWVTFFIENRLEVQIGLAYYKRLIDENFLKKFKNIYPRLYDILPQENPSLIHGDLWSGNIMVDAEGDPCLIDPAVYYGHREAEIAYSTLFGGFDADFYNSYKECFPLLPGFDSRIEIYNIYHLLVHVNLFGLSYLSPVEKAIRKLQ